MSLRIGYRPAFPKMGYSHICTRGKKAPGSSRAKGRCGYSRDTTGVLHLLHSHSCSKGLKLHQHEPPASSLLTPSTRHSALPGLDQIIRTSSPWPLSSAKEVDERREPCPAGTHHLHLGDKARGWGSHLALRLLPSPLPTSSSRSGTLLLEGGR